MYKFLIFIIGILSFSGNIFATVFPFTDVNQSSEYYSSVKYLFDNRIISDDGSHLFKANEPINRDVFLGFSVSVSCRKCITPSSEDIIKYQSSPFIDLRKSNPYFYCIAYANENGIAQGYTLDNNGSSRCEDGKTYSSSPFCEKNKTTRIEAAGMLLRQAKLWDDSRNSNFQKTMEISDISGYWYGYAEKGIQAGILSLKNGNKVLPDESISRGEFALMASKVLSYNQCSVSDINNQLQSQILLVDTNGKEIQKSVIPTGSSYLLIPQISNFPETFSGSKISYDKQWDYSWKLSNPVSGEVRTGSGDRYKIDNLSCGQWISELGVIDKSSGITMSTSSSTFFIECNDNNKEGSNNLSVNIHANPLSIYIGKGVDFTSYISGGNGKIEYKWDFGDSVNSSSKGPINHKYDSEGIYTVSLTIIDEKGNVAQSKIAISIDGNRDTDNDTIFDDEDLCPFVYGEKDNNGCPKIIINQYDKIMRGKLGEKNNNPSSVIDSDRDGVLDYGDGNGNDIDLCPYVVGKKENQGCPNISIFSDLGKNICLANKSKSSGIIMGEPICTICPCDNSISILTPVRSCDVLFPSILSVDQKTVFSRGSLYQVQ